MEIAKWLMNDGEWLMYGFIYLFTLSLILNLIVYLYRINFDDNYDPWGNK